MRSPSPHQSRRRCMIFNFLRLPARTYLVADQGSQQRSRRKSHRVEHDQQARPTCKSGEYVCAQRNGRAWEQLLCMCAQMGMEHYGMNVTGRSRHIPGTAFFPFGHTDTTHTYDGRVECARGAQQHCVCWRDAEDVAHLQGRTEMHQQ